MRIEWMFLERLEYGPTFRKGRLKEQAAYHQRKRCITSSRSNRDSPKLQKCSVMSSTWYVHTNKFTQQCHLSAYVKTWVERIWNYQKSWNSNSEWNLFCMPCQKVIEKTVDPNLSSTLIEIFQHLECWWLFSQGGLVSLLLFNSMYILTKAIKIVHR